MDDDGTVVERDALPRLPSLELSRYSVVVAMVTTSLCLGWVVYAALDLREPIRGGLLGASDVARLDRASGWLALAIIVSTPLQSIWCAMAVRWSRRDGFDGVSQRRSVGLTIGSVVAATGSMLCVVFDVSAGLAASSILVASICTWLSVLGIAPIADRLDRPVVIIRLWAVGQFVTVIVTTAAGGFGSVDPSTNIETLAFVGVGQNLVAAVSAVLAGVFALDVEDSLRSSSRLARWSAQRASRSSAP
jgi:hypothetical protein